MKKIFPALLITIILILFIPYSITIAMNGIKDTESEIIPYDGRIVLVENNDIKMSLDYSVYLVGMTAKMLSAYDTSVFEYPEFIKLCIVLSNTYLAGEFPDESVITNDILSDRYLSDDELKYLWKDQYQSYTNAIKLAIQETGNLIISYDNSPVSPLYHFISNGMTRCDAKRPYLKAVSTNEDLEEMGFLCVKQITCEDFLKTIKKALPDLIISDDYNQLKDNIQIMERDSSGYIKKLKIGSLIMSGDDFMQIMGINSPSFTITFQENTLKIITKGIGHGYGISMSYALRLAKAGYSYQDIISFFYENVEIKNAN